MAIILGLDTQITRQCPGDSAEVSAITEPAGMAVFWRVDGVARDPAPKIAVGLKASPTLVEASLDTSLDSVELPAHRVASMKLEFEPNLLPGPVDFLISGSPAPPTITIRAVGTGGAASGMTWTATLIAMDATFIGEFCSSSAALPRQEIDLSPSGNGNSITIPFDGRVRGGRLFVRAEGSVNGCPVKSSGVVNIGGTNPDREEIQKALPHDTLRRIACVESGQRQFLAPADGGTSMCPLVGAGIRVGVMQVQAQSPEQIWSWRENVLEGIRVFQAREKESAEYPESVRQSAGFKALVQAFNDKRVAEGRNPVEVSLPAFTRGNFDNDLKELELDTIRGYDGWIGEGRFGLPLHEFRVAVDSVGGQELLRVTLSDDESSGTANWERVPAADRPQDPGRPNYVDLVLAANPTCGAGPSPVEELPKCGAKLRFLDFQNDELMKSTSALSVSHHVSDDGALGLPTAGFADVSTDRNAFRLEVEDPSGGASVQVRLKVGSRPAQSYTLAAKSGSRYRGAFLRLVTDSFDDAVLGTQTVLCSLGEKVTLTYQRTNQCRDQQTLRIGRPPGENDNAHPDPSRHDIRRLKVNVVIFSKSIGATLAKAVDAAAGQIAVNESLVNASSKGFFSLDLELIRYTSVDRINNIFKGCTRGAAGSQAKSHAAGDLLVFPTGLRAMDKDFVNQQLDAVDERFAQCGITLKRPVTIRFGGIDGNKATVTPKFSSQPLPLHPALLFPYDEPTFPVTAPNVQLQALADFSNGERNTVQVFYLESISANPPLGGLTHGASSNATGDVKFQNLVVMAELSNELSLAHELMHVLLDRPHSLLLQPVTALFHRGAGALVAPAKAVNSTKRIGPYPDATHLQQGMDDTRVMRDHAEALP